MEVLDLSNISREQKEVLTSHINMLIEASYNNEEQDIRREAVDRAIKQEFRDDYPYGYHRLNSNQQLSRFDAENEEEIDGSDEFTSLYAPIILSLYRTWVTTIKNACFPANGDWVDIVRRNSLFFSKLGLRDFLPFANQAWIKIIKTENQRYGFKEKYASSIAENISYGNTGIIHFYDPIEHYVDVKIPGIRDFAVYPATDRWKDSNLVVRYDINYSELQRRGDFNQEFVRAIKPSSNSLDFWGDQDYGRGSTRQQEYEEHFVPNGKVRLFDIFIPSLYLEDPADENDPIQGENIYFTVAYQPEFKTSASVDQINDGQSTLILKASRDVENIEHGILLGSAGTTLPGVFFHQGMLIPFLPHQLLMNQMYSGMGRTAALLVDPPLSLVRNADFDYEQTPPQELVPGATYEGYEVKALVPPEYYQVVDQFRAVSEYVSRSVEEGSGVSKNQLGVVNTGKRSAREIGEVNSAGQMNVVEATSHFDEQILQPSVTIRIQRTQGLLREQIEREVADFQVPEVAANDIYDSILVDNDLFMRLLEFSGIENSYEEFYQQRQHELQKNQEVILQIEDMIEEINTLQQFVESPIPPFIAPPTQIDPTTGQSIPSELEIQQLADQYEAAQEEQRKQALEQIKQMQLQLEAKRLQIKDIQQIPEPSYKLYYDLLTYPIKDSDVVVTGSQTSLSKDLARQNMNVLLNTISAMPPDVQSKVNFESLLGKVAKASDMPLMDIKKDEADLRREEEAAAKEAELQQTLTLQAAQVPGAQPPKTE